MRGITRWIVGSVALAALALPASAGAVQTFGSNLNASPTTADPGLTDPFTVANEGLPAASTASGGFNVPIDGVVVRWRIKAGGTADPVAFQLARFMDPSGTISVGTSGTVDPQLNTTTVSPTRLPVSAGDFPALRISAGDGFTFTAATSSSNFMGWSPPLQEGQAPRGSFGISGSEQLLINADVEPDADGDGFGDETQDCAPTDPSRNVDCTGPDTQITKGPKDKTKRKRATFEFTGIEARAVARFECSLDGTEFVPCNSPYQVKVKKGKHTFAVRAADELGNFDAAPATDSWKVKKKRRK